MFDAIGQYKILDKIGAGSLGEIYRARDTRHGRTVAIRMVGGDYSADPARRERLLQQIRRTAALSHPNIATVYEVGDEQGQPFVASEFVPGETLAHTIAGRPLNPRHAVDLAMQIADGLADAHAEGIRHHALRPDAVIVTPKGAAKILDFGVAAAGAAPAGAYLAPEQVAGGEADERADVFALGLVLFEMLTGRPPFSGPRPADRSAAAGAGQKPLPVPSAVNPASPRELDAIVAKASAAIPAARYEAAATLAAELRSIGAILDVRNDAANAAASPQGVGRGLGVRGIALGAVALGLLIALWVLVSRVR